jgi:hypothetical protein
MAAAYQILGLLISFVLILSIILGGLFVLEIVEEKTNNINIEYITGLLFIAILLFSPYVIFSLVLPVFQVLPV